MGDPAGEDSCGKRFGCWMLKCIFSPIILLFYSIVINIGGCLGAYGDRFVRGLFCGICVSLDHTYKDKKFPSEAKSVGPWKGQTLTQVEQTIEWKRIKDVIKVKDDNVKGGKLFSGGIKPKDICQGQIGDCWLMSALACLAETQGAIPQLFLTREYTHYGRYKIRLYDKLKGKMNPILVDDWIPVKKGTSEPVFAKASEDAAWVLLMEKAFAKFMGSYSELDGGSTLYALETLTGNFVFKFKLAREGSNYFWQRYELVHTSSSKGGRGQVALTKCKEKLSSNDLFDTLVHYKRKRSVVAASSGDGTDTQHINGIVQGHAYSVIQAVEVEKFRMLQLRNPWGSFEWTGDWGDDSPLWKQNPKVAAAVDFKPADDGTFWMEWKDFCLYFANLDFCFRTTGMDDLAIDIHEEHPCCGPTCGCVEGCCTFWFCCKGCRALLCGNKKQKFEQAPRCCGCMAAL